MYKYDLAMIGGKEKLNMYRFENFKLIKSFWLQVVSLNGKGHAVYQLIVSRNNIYLIET